MGIDLVTVSRVVNVFAALAAVVGGVFALWSFEQESMKRLDDKKKATLEFVRLFNSSEFLSVRTSALGFLDKGGSCNTNIGSGSERLNVFTYVDFFDTVMICVNEQICDGRTAFEFFERYANYHWIGFKTHIEENRSIEAKFNVAVPYGVGLERFARTPIDVFGCRGQQAPR